jgi:PAS domain S-box-containing protein
MQQSENFHKGHDIFFAAIEKTRMPMVLTDPNLPDNPIVFMNSAFSELTGYSEMEIMGRNCRFLQGQDTDPDTVNQVRQAIKLRQDVSVEILNYRKDGSQFWNALYISPVYDDTGHLRFFFASQLDVSRRITAEEALRQAQKMEAVGQLTGGIAHDFNNMLTVIQGNIELAMLRASEDPKILQPLERASKGALHAAKLTEQLLSFARKQRLNSVTTNLNEMVSSMIDILARTLGGNILIETNLVDDLALVEVDVVQLNAAVLNVVINARDAMPQGGHICITSHNETVGDNNELGVAPGNFSVMSFKDTGTGIPAEHITHVTEPFYTTKEVGKGTGMGLAMVYGFLKQSGGHLTIDSDSTGTNIKFYLRHSDKARTHSENIRKVFKASSRRTERLLLVEDNEQVMEMIRGSVEDQGYDVRFAASAADAMKIIESGFEPEILCSDIVMPGQLNGVDLARELKIRYPNIRILLCTGWADRYLDREDFPVLVKPYKPSQLVSRLAGLTLSRHEG